MECNMPTSVREEDAREVTSRLYEEVGQTTNNQSLKISLEMLRDLYA